MTSQQDPNQPGQPTPWGATPDPNQPGWAALPQEQPAAQPDWGAPPPPVQPGWGAPPPPVQPGWGAPPPPVQPGWGAPPPPGYSPAPGWGAPPPPSSGNKHGCLIAFVVVLVLCLVGVGGCGVLVWNAIGPAVQMDLKITQDLGTTQVSSVSFNEVNGDRMWVIHVRSGYESDAVALACNIVRPDLESDPKFANDSFEIVDSYGNVLASESTPCP